MKIRHINGVKVCMVEDDLNHFIDAYDYKDVVNAINYIFKQAEISEVPRNGRYGDPMSIALIDIAATCNVKMQRISTKENNVVCDEDQMLAKAKKPKPILKRLTNSAGMYRGLKVLAGGKVTAQ
jgi:hypothetical protein